MYLRKRRLARIVSAAMHKRFYGRFGINHIKSSLDFKVVWPRVRCRKMLTRKVQIMTTYIPQAVQDALDEARMKHMRKSSRMRIYTDGESFAVLRLWETGFSVEAANTPQLRGLVDLFDGARYVSQCLIVASEEEAGEMRYEFKRATPATDAAPLDFYRAPDAPVGFIEGPS